MGVIALIGGIILTAAFGSIAAIQAWKHKSTPGPDFAPQLSFRIPAAITVVGIILIVLGIRWI